MGGTCSGDTNAHVSSSTVGNYSSDKKRHNNKFITFLRKTMWEYALACVGVVPCGGNNDLNGQRKTTLEHNKAWLLADSGAELASADPRSVHSSFRFSFCSQVEVESFNMSYSASAAAAAAAATFLMVNLDYESQVRELKWRRIQSLEKSLSPVANTLIRFSYDEILSATRNFSKERVLGRGALSCVFRGRVGIWRTAVAIKRLDKEDKECAKAFCRELMIASSLNDTNVVPLVGFCIDSEEGLFLVYKYVSGGSLEHHLHASWTSAPSVPFLCKTVKGTFGYLAPEYFEHGKVSDKTDVYALGVVLLELLTGRNPIEAKRPPGEENLVVWAKPLLRKGKGAIEELLDPQVKYNSSYTDQMVRMIDAASVCVTSEESRRPSIGEIVAILKGEVEHVLSRRRKSGYFGNGYMIDNYPKLQETNNEMKSHLALAMLGVPECEDDDFVYCR
ncbi:hypothetical protein JHK85_005469 [Glycine max]|nr:hypothetical protein JHK85_005469 [Glycine max]